jgi:5-methylcytosine-specific restriction protein A
VVRLGQRGVGQRKHDAKRGPARERGYNTRWDKARKTFLMRSPLCVMCQKEGRVTPARVVDYIIPHKGDTALLWDTSNWQGLCFPHHYSNQVEGRARQVSGSG